MNNCDELIIDICFKRNIVNDIYFSCVEYDSFQISDFEMEKINEKIKEIADILELKEKKIRSV